MAGKIEEIRILNSENVQPNRKIKLDFTRRGFRLELSLILMVGAMCLERIPF